MKLLVALIMWFPFSIPKDTTPKVVIVNETQNVKVVNNEKSSGRVYITKGKEITVRVKVKIIIPDLNKEKNIYSKNRSKNK